MVPTSGVVADVTVSFSSTSNISSCRSRRACSPAEPVSPPPHRRSLTLSPPLLPSFRHLSPLRSQISHSPSPVNALISPLYRQRPSSSWPSAPTVLRPTRRRRGPGAPLPWPFPASLVTRSLQRCTPPHQQQHPHTLVQEGHPSAGQPAETVETDMTAGMM